MKVEDVNKIELPKHMDNLIIEGSVLTSLYDQTIETKITKEEMKLLRTKFKKLVMNFKCVVFCRTTPNQKATMVKMVKSEGKITLAIGDGANDVNMIQAAHLGIGIVGNEGKQAANTSDFAIQKFCHIEKYK